jgi:hypothetical protein
MTHSRRLRSCSVLGGFINPPLPSVLTPTSVQQGPFAPRALPRFVATTNLAAAVSSSADFPGVPVIRPTWLRRFLGGTRTVSPVARHVLVTVLPLTTPPKCHAASVSPRHNIQPSPRTRGLGLRSHFFCRGHHWVHLRYGPVTRSPSQGWLGRSASSASFPPRVRPKLRRSLTLPPVGLSPTEHASLSWTHWSTKMDPE